MWIQGAFYITGQYFDVHKYKTYRTDTEEFAGFYLEEYGVIYHFSSYGWFLNVKLLKWNSNWTICAHALSLMLV